VRALTSNAAAAGVAVIDARSTLLQRAEPWILPEWEESLSHALAGAGLLSARDTLAIDAIVQEVAAHPFVAEVGVPEVVWPDGLLLPLRMRMPVACLQVEGGGFLPVSDDGIILPGWSSAPHSAFGGWLPVIGPHEPGLAQLLPGDRLTETRHLDALAVAITMWNHLEVQDLADLGRVFIDASREFGPQGMPGGVRIDLELRRRILFGRPPGTPFPGELPWEAKWRNVSRGLEALRRGDDWDSWDVRWDEPEPIRRQELAGPVQDGDLVGAGH
jgi:hypothetical protein